MFGRIQSLATKTSQQASASLEFANAQVAALTAHLEEHRKAATQFAGRVCQELWNRRADTERNMRATSGSIAAGRIGMHAITRSLLVALLVVATGCKSAGGKAFGTIGVASAVGAGYLFATSSTSLEDHGLVTRNDHMDAAAGLMFGSVFAAAGWAICELMARDPTFGSVGGYAPAPSAPGEAPVPEVAPLPEVAPVAPAAADNNAPGPPVVIVVPDRGQGGRGRSRPGWRIDPEDGQDKLYGLDGEVIGHLNPAGYVWDRSGDAIGRVDMTSGCDLACKHAQAREMLLGPGRPR